jgi:uncharacterized membrane protein
MFRLLGEEPLAKKDVPSLLEAFAVLVLPFLLLLHGGAWLARRRGAVNSRTEATAKLCQVLWPLLFSITAVIVGVLRPTDRGVLLEISGVAPIALAVGLVLWQLFEWMPNLLRLPSEPNDARLALLRYGSPTAAFILFCCVWFSYLTVMRHASFGSCSHDFSIYDQLLWNAYNGYWFEVGMLNDTRILYDLAAHGNNYNAEHFSPGFFIVYPLFLLIPSTYTLIAFHAIMGVLGAVPTFFIALKKLVSPTLAALFSIAYLVHPCTEQAIIKDIHVDTFAPVFILAAYAFYLYGQRILFFACLLMALSMKEEISLGIMGMGLFLFFGERDRKIGAATFALGAAWLVAVVGFIMPAFREGDAVRHLYRFSEIVPKEWGIDMNDITKADILKAMIFHPHLWIATLLDGGRIQGFLLLLAPYGMLALFGRWAWLWLAPPLGIAMLSWFTIQFTMEQQYGTPHLSALTVASILGAAWLLRRDLPESEPLPRPRLGAGVGLLGMAIIIFWSQWAAFPFGGRYRAEDYRILPHNEIGYRFLEAIPQDAVVTASIELAPHLTPRRFFYMFPTMLDAEWVFLDTRAMYWPIGDVQEFEDRINDLLTNGEWGLVKPYEDGFLLFRKGHSTELNSTAISNLDFKPYRRRRHF